MLEKPSLSNATQTVYSNLRRRLMTGFYTPGTQLKEEHLAEELEVSRTPVRGALRRLVKDGMLIAEVHRGVFVAEWTNQDITEVFELRRLLEPHAAGLAARNATPEQIAILKRFNLQMAEAARSEHESRTQEVQSINNQFHRLIIEASCSPRLKSMLENLVSMPMVVGSFFLYSTEEMLRSVQHHELITEAIEAGDRDYAEQAMRLHLKATHLLFMERRSDKPNKPFLDALRESS